MKNFIVRHMVLLKHQLETQRKLFVETN